MEEYRIRIEACKKTREITQVIRELNVDYGLTMEEKQWLRARAKYRARAIREHSEKNG